MTAGTAQGDASRSARSTTSVAFVRSLLTRLAETQWYTPRRIWDLQANRLSALLRHAVEAVPFYRERFAGIDLDEAVASPQRWLDLPLLRRRDLQTGGDTLVSQSLAHDARLSRRIITSGATGEPVMVLQPPRVRLVWQAFTLREHRWHARDFNGTLAVIRHVRRGQAMAPDGQVHENWGEATRSIDTGPSVLLNIDCTLSEQAAWLATQNPSYLLTYPSNLNALAQHFERTGDRLPELRGLRVIGEVLKDETRATCAKVFGVPVIDMYTAQEVGYIALQCPETDHYHVQSENVLVEVIDEDGQPCQPGDVGRVVVTSLHNFVSPLIRYEIGDYAMVGAPCSCGRGLPVLTRIMGRQRNMLVLPNGERRWPSIGQGEDLVGLPPFHQVQIIQRTVHQMELRAVVPAPLTEAQENQARNYVQRMFGYPFEVVFKYVDEIPRSAGRKMEDFKSEVAD